VVTFSGVGGGGRTLKRLGTSSVREDPSRRENQAILPEQLSIGKGKAGTKSGGVVARERPQKKK